VNVEADGEVIKGSLLCNLIPNRSTAEIKRYVVAPNSNDPVEFEVQGCVGL
jgi:hypothetical protein